MAAGNVYACASGNSNPVTGNNFRCSINNLHKEAYGLLFSFVPAPNLVHKIAKSCQDIESFQTQTPCLHFEITISICECLVSILKSPFQYANTPFQF
jgi:hypothetical protein